MAQKLKRSKYRKWIFFLEKKLINFSCTYQPLSFCKILKKFIEPIQSYEDVLFSDPKWPICPEQHFFGTNHYCYLQLLIGHFHCVKFQKNSYSKSRVMRMHCSWVQNGPFAPNKSFFENYLYHSHVQNLKKIFQQIQSYKDVQLLGPKWLISSNENFFLRKPVNKPCFFHSCLSTCQKSKSDINLLVKYWRLKNTEISLAKSNFWL